MESSDAPPEGRFASPVAGLLSQRELWRSPSATYCRSSHSSDYELRARDACDGGDIDRGGGRRALSARRVDPLASSAVNKVDGAAGAITTGAG